MTQENLQEIKMALREEQCPYFTDEEILFYFGQCKGNIKDTIYRCLIVKAQDTTLQVSGLSVADTSKYFRRLASHYRRSNSGILAVW